MLQWWIGITLKVELRRIRHEVHGGIEDVGGWIERAVKGCSVGWDGSGIRHPGRHGALKSGHIPPVSREEVETRQAPKVE